MRDEEMMRLWDPQAPAAGAESIQGLEDSLASLRGPRRLPVLELAPRRSTHDELPDAASQSPEGLWPTAAILLLAAALLLAFFATHANSEATPSTEGIAQAPAPPEQRQALDPAPAPPPSPTGWRVERFEGDAMCNAPGVEQVVQAGASLTEGMPLDTGPGSTAQLQRGEARIDLHPNSRIVAHEDALELVYGRIWAELPALTQAGADSATWLLRTRGVSLRTQRARFVWWAYEVQDGAPQALAPTRDTIGIEVVSGRVEWVVGDRQIVVEAGQRCELDGAPQAEAEVSLRCRDAAPERK